MAYIGNSPANVGNYQIVDNIASGFNGSATSFALASGSVGITPAKSGQLLVNINGVMQQPDDAGTNGFKVSGSNIVFSSAPANGDTFWAVYQGQNVDIGTPSDDVVDTAHIKDNAITADKIAAGAVVADIATGGITTAKIADDAVTEDKLANAINSAIAANTAKTGITSGQASAITANTAKTGITSSQASAITANTAKTGITSSQASAITANTAKTTNATHTGDVTGSTALTIAADAVDIGMLSATGTPGNTTFLRGDNTWATAGSTSASDLTSGTLPIARIADDAITLAKMAPGTDGNIISYDASGNPVAIATGSDGQVLTSTGAGSPPAFETLTAGGPSLGTDSIIRTNAQTISENITIGSTTNGMSAGPITIADGNTVTVNGNWSIV